MTAITNSVLIGVCASALTLLVSLPLASVFAFRKFRGKKILELMIYVPIIVPQLSGAIALHRLFLRLGICDTFFGVVLSHAVMCLPYSVFILKDAFSSLGCVVEESARDLGAGSLSAFYDISLPLLRGSIVASCGFSFIISLSQYLTTLFIGGGKFITLPLLLFPLVQSGERADAAVFSTIFVAVGFIFCVFIGRKGEKYVGRG